MKKLRIKVNYKLNDKEEELLTEVPYVLNSRQDLPDVYPFNQNVYFGPDDGEFLGRIYIDEKGRLDYCGDLITLKEGITIYNPTKTGRYIFEIEIVDK